MSEWFSASELAGLQGMPGTVQGINARAKRDGWQSRQRDARGGGREYHIDSLPEATRAALILRQMSAQSPVCASAGPDDAAAPAQTYDRETLWARYERATDRKKAKAREKTELLNQVEVLVERGLARRRALAQVASHSGTPLATLRGWYYGQNGKPGARDYERCDWLAAMLPGQLGCRQRAQCSPEAWEMFKALYLTRAQRSIADCYERVREVAVREGWAWPVKKTIERRVKQDLTRRVCVLLREGPEAADRLVPPMSRDRSQYHAMQAVNGDGVEFKAQCRWPDGSVAHAKVWVWQDLYSNYILTWRADQSENKDMIRLAFGDLVEQFGIPSRIFIDNTRAAASKWLTGGTQNRYRWKIRDEDPLGIMPQVGVDVRFVTPGHGQAKPIERAFRDLRQLVDKNPRFEGRGTLARPVPIEEFMQVLEIEIQRHNAREGRRTDVADGRSFEAVFRESYERSTIRRATEEQRRLWLLAAEHVRANRDDGHITLGRGPQGENRYWSARMAEYAGQSLVVRFDPQRLHEAVHVYTPDGSYLCRAECTWRAGFEDADAARAYHRWRQRQRRHLKRAAEAERGMHIATAAKRLAEPERPDPPEPGVVQGQFQQTRPKRVVGSDLTDTEPRPQDDIERHRKTFDDVVLAAGERWRKEQL